MKNAQALKEAAAEYALQFIPEDGILGIGTGSTVNCFIERLASKKGQVEGTVASSEASAQRLRALNIPVFDLNSVPQVQCYIDGADEVNDHHQLIKGGGGAHTREKILATVAQEFICLVDASKHVATLGEFPVAVEVLPMARSHVGRSLVKLGGDPVYREGFVTDNGNLILDVYQLDLSQPAEMEQRINQIVGVVENGLFAARRADKVVMATPEGVRCLPRHH